jgi:putative tryptophan/tyrosine transport system substrate-binding protein
MRRRKFIVLLGGAAAWPLAARAQAKRIPRVGVLMGLVESDATDQSHLTAFRDALAKLGWTDGRNIRIEVRWGGGDPALYARGAAELVALNAEVLVSEGTPATEALHQQTRTIPIVFIAAADPMGQGFVASLARPGGNITGFSALAESSIGPIARAPSSPQTRICEQQSTKKKWRRRPAAAAPPSRLEPAGLRQSSLESVRARVRAAIVVNAGW